MQSEAPKTSDQLLKTVTEKADELINLLRYNSLGPEKILEFVCYDKVVRMHLPFAMQDRLQNLILRHLHFSEYLPLYAIRELITPGSVFVDAGANIGNHTLFFSLICEAAMVYAFEPMKEAFKTLQRNLSINGVTNVTAWNCGLGGAASAAKLKRYSHLNFGMASLDPNEKRWRDASR
jgi:protein O-GlcNAc transferase